MGSAEGRILFAGCLRASLRCTSSSPCSDTQSVAVPGIVLQPLATFLMKIGRPRHRGSRRLSEGVPQMHIFLSLFRYSVGGGAWNRSSAPSYVPDEDRSAKAPRKQTTAPQGFHGGPRGAQTTDPSTGGVGWRSKAGERLWRRRWGSTQRRFRLCRSGWEGPANR